MGGISRISGQAVCIDTGAISYDTGAIPRDTEGASYDTNKVKRDTGQLVCDTLFCYLFRFLLGCLGFFGERPAVSASYIVGNEKILAGRDKTAYIVLLSGIASR